MNLPAIVIANGIAVGLLVILLISSFKTIHFGLLDTKIFIAMVSITIIQSVIETVTFLIDGNTAPGLRTLSMILNTLLFINNIGFAFIWTVYADYKLFFSVDRIKRIYPFVAIPALLVFGAAIVNLFTPVLFRISAQNVYERTDFFLLPYLLTYFYLAYGVILIYTCRKKVDHYLFLPAIVFMVPILLGSVLQYFFYGFSLVWVGVSIALTSLYINVQNENACLDTLSGLLTRQYLNRYLSNQFRRSDFCDGMYGIMLDIDDFKGINDTHGHLVGDDAVASIGKILRSSVSAKDLAMRYAGDEFIVIKPRSSEKEVRKTVQKIQENTDLLNTGGKKPYQLRFSLGSCKYNANDSIDSFLKRLDDAMYAVKNEKKKNGTYALDNKPAGGCERDQNGK